MDDLQKEDYMLKANIDHLEKEITGLEKKKRDLFNQGVGASQIKKQMLVLQISQTDTEIRTKRSEFADLFKRYTLIANLTTLKRHEKALQGSPVWNKLRGLSSQKLLGVLAGVDLSGKKDSEVLDALNSMFEIGASRTDSSFNIDSGNPIFDAWSSVEAGNIDVEAIENQIFDAPSSNLEKP